MQLAFGDIQQEERLLVSRTSSPSPQSIQRGERGRCASSPLRSTGGSARRVPRYFRQYRRSLPDTANVEVKLIQKFRRIFYPSSFIVFLYLSFTELSWIGAAG
ncbi:hypothetical protein NHX12_023314 [Muraenolepis orangiensis]|uniref:Uncharacterized protein n=1 Tax=Muraenolepis orangiensis TaxID=630683 RepID=A0A9Q0IS11_9TELE|nr:hypothetical protein NHX12_023314 [Muraenolepis orangiensis]